MAKPPSSSSESLRFPEPCCKMSCRAKEERQDFPALARVLSSLVVLTLPVQSSTPGVAGLELLAGPSHDVLLKI